MTELDVSNPLGFSKEIFIHLPDDLVVAVNDLYELAGKALAFRDQWRDLLAEELACCKGRQLGFPLAPAAVSRCHKTLVEICDFLDEHPEFRRIAALQAKEGENGTH